MCLISLISMAMDGSATDDGETGASHNEHTAAGKEAAEKAKEIPRKIIEAIKE